jgi:predicted tellurium resistance membrane protein TerC
VLIGVYLVIEGLEIHVPKAYVYGPMGFSALVETLNLWAKRRALARGLED